MWPARGIRVSGQAHEPQPESVKKETRHFGTKRLRQFKVGQKSS